MASRGLDHEADTILPLISAVAPVQTSLLDEAGVTQSPSFGRSAPLPPLPPTLEVVGAELAPPSVVESSVLDDRAQLLVLDALPVAAMLVDNRANIRYLNAHAADLVGVPKDDLLGRSVFDFVSLEYLDFVAELINGGACFENQLMGPSRVRYVGADGETHWTQIWAQRAPQEVCEGGFVVTLTGESVRDVLTVTATSVESNSSLQWTLSGVAQSARGLPLVGQGVILTVETTAPVDEREFRLVGDWPIDHALMHRPDTPWRRALDEIRDADVADVADVASSNLPGDVRTALLDAGIRALFVRPIPSSKSEAVGVFVIFRFTAGPASTNQNDHIADAIHLARFAFATARRQIELKRASHRDALTGVANRAAFNDRLRAERRATDVLFIDLDRFKDVNDTFGHEIGDRVLAIAAERIESAIRRVDRVFRTGGDEFIVLSESTGDDPGERIAVAERIIELLMEPFDVDMHRVRIGATIGIAASGTRSIVEAVRAADTALYRAKERGRSGWAHEGH